MKFYLQTYDDKSIELSKSQIEKLTPVLLQSGKFILVGEDLINISSIKSITKQKTHLTDEEKYSNLPEL